MALWADPLSRMYQRVSNAVYGQDFNRLAWEEAHKDAAFECDVVDKDGQDEDDCNDDEGLRWSGVLTVPREKEADPFVIKRAPSKFQQLTNKISEKSLLAASGAAGCSIEYARHALKFLAVESAREIGWLANCTNVSEALSAVKAKFPILEDMKRAYESGSLQGREQQRRQRIAYGTHYRHDAGGIVTHPREIKDPSNGDRTPIIGHLTIRTSTAVDQGNRIYDPRIHGELMEVPAHLEDASSSEEKSGQKNRVVEESFADVVMPPPKQKEKRRSDSPSERITSFYTRLSQAPDAPDMEDVDLSDEEEAPSPVLSIDFESTLPRMEETAVGIGQGKGKEAMR